MELDSSKVDILESSRGLRFVKVEYPSEVWMPLHTHEGAASLNFCIEGTLQEFRDQKTFVQGPSSLSLMPRGIPHGNCFPKGVSTFLIVLEAQWIEQFRQISTLVDSPLCCQVGRPAWMAACMYREFRRRDNLTVLTLEGMLLELLAEMARDTAIHADKNSPGWLGKVTDYLHAHFTQSLSTEMIASAVGVHAAHLMRSFRQQHHCTIGEYVRRLRVEYACHLLLTSHVSLGEIALDVGFSDQSHFNRTFKRYKGMSPKEFQRVSGRATLSPKTHS